MAEERVATRVASGGHDIPKDTIHRRYWAGLQNLFEIFVPIVDLWSLYDNSNNANPIVKNNVVFNHSMLSNIKELCRKKKE